MVFVRLIGGFGNQLFQLQFANWLRDNMEACVFLDTSFYKTAKKPHERYWLDNINLEYTTNFLSEDCLHFRRKLERAAYKLNIPVWLRIGSRFCFEGDVCLGANKGLIYDGFWQNKRFVNINYLLELSKKIEFFRNEVNYPQIASSRVMVHVRRGDYVTDMRGTQKVHMVLEPQYYEVAMRTLEEKYNVTGFDIYSDDSSWCENFFAKHNCKIIDTSNLTPPALLAAMSRYPHNIIANSTLSWWAGAISSTRGGTVVIPYNWNFSLSCEHLRLDGWQAI